MLILALHSKFASNISVAPRNRGEKCRGVGNPAFGNIYDELIPKSVIGILRRDQTLDTVGDALIEMIIRTSNGHLTAAEALGHREFSMTKLYRST